MSKAILYTIPFSHYCDKARWALELAEVPFEERGFLPGLNRLATMRFGGTTVPLLVRDGLVLKDSTAIVSYADRSARSEKGRLIPRDPAQREDAVALEAHLDRRLGVATRAWIYSFLLDNPRRIRELASQGVSRAQALALGPLQGTLITMIRKGLRIGPETRAWARTRVDEDFAMLSERLSDGRDFLLGDQLTVADLTLATLAAPALLPPEYPAALPSVDELPEEAAQQIKTWHATPAGAHALRIYREHRGAARIA